MVVDNNIFCVFNVCMKRTNVFLEEEQIEFLRKLPGKVSEHIRRALDEYIYRLKGTDTSTSRSKKGGEANG